MKQALVLGVVAVVIGLPSLSSAEENILDPLDQWGQWRGPLGSGVAPRGDPPARWAEGHNIRWKTAIPGKGQSTPVIWGDRVFLTTAVPFGEALTPRHAHEHAHGDHDNVEPQRRMKFIVLALNRRDGSILWERTVAAERPHESTHETGSWASASAVTNGEHVITSFGSRGLFALDMNGEVKWRVDLGDMQTKHGHGEGSSPALFGDTVVVNWDHEGESFVVALDKRTGKERWKAERDELSSWSSPLIVQVDGAPQVIISATNRVRGYNLASGEVVWSCGGLSGNVVATPVAADGIVYVANSYETREMLAIRLPGATGDITGTDAVLWARHRNTPYVPSPVLYGDMLCFLKHYQGLLTCVNAKTGAELFGPERLDGIQNVFASLVGASGRIYIADRDGTTAVVKHGSRFELLAQNKLDDSFSASPAIVGKELYLRGEHHLYCIARGGAE